MPTSTYDGRKWVTDRLADSTVTTVVDVGPGRGTYSILGRHLIWWARWIGVEIHEPYVERFMLGELYDDLIIADVRDWEVHLEDYAILFGDVLEHMPKQDAIQVINFHLMQADEIYVSVPIVDSPQGECFGNPHEAHIHQWTFEEMDALLPDAESFKGVQVGRWYWRREDNDGGSI